MTQVKLLKPLTKAEIDLLPVDLRPNYIGTDSEGAYKVDGYGIKRREGERGGPPSKVEKPTKATKRSIDKILEEHTKWAEPAEILLAVANGDKDFFNKRDRDMDLTEIPLFMRVDAANKLMAFSYCKPIPKTDEDGSPSNNDDNKPTKPKVMVILGSNTRELSVPVNNDYNGLPLEDVYE